MNGYSLRSFGDFTEKWRLITARYRKDTDELRLTYANDIAWTALASGSTNYPDGAVFAKVGLRTEEDPAFVSSAVPSGAKRYQLMVRNASRHAETGGWGYALFDANGLTFNEAPHVQARACHACHELVPDRGYVFSQSMQITAGTARAAVAKSDIPFKRLAFETIAVAMLPQAVQAELTPSITFVRLLQGSITKSVFQGTVDEIRPSLIAEHVRARMPAILTTEDGRLFSIAGAADDVDACGQVVTLPEDTPVQVTYTSMTGKEGAPVVTRMTICHH